MPMPRLSPSMRTGVLHRWLISVGDELDSMEVACEVETRELTDDADDGSKVLQIEAHEDGFLAAVLVAEGSTAKPDEAIAVIVDSIEDIEAFREYPLTQTLPIVEPATFAWQAYLKDADSQQCSNS